MSIFERPYHKKNSNEPRSDPIFGVYTDEPYGISYEFFKRQILGHQQLTLLIWPRKNRHNRRIANRTAEPNSLARPKGSGFSNLNKNFVFSPFRAFVTNHFFGSIKNLASSRSWGVVTLILFSDPGITFTGIPIFSIIKASSVISFQSSRKAF